MPGLSPTSKLIGCFDAGPSALAVSEAELPRKAELLHRGPQPRAEGNTPTLLPSLSLRRPDTELLFHPLPLAHLLRGGVGKGGAGWGMTPPSLTQSILTAPGEWGCTLGCSLSPSARNSETPLDTAATPRTSLLQAFGPTPKL